MLQAGQQELRFDSWQGLKAFLFSQISKPAQVPRATQHPAQTVPKALSLLIIAWKVKLATHFYLE
jgi:hypothetical protein